MRLCRAVGQDPRFQGTVDTGENLIRDVPWPQVLPYLGWEIHMVVGKGNKHMGWEVLGLIPGCRWRREVAGGTGQGG